ncbi:hypothetical protein RRG08_066208 [Elysia crispata]|uniref:PiggyBac transposable element-derived protein domain-containing protein n=1 Tax=Elysia crispata TaxID=231223 RepID=A0AAE0YUK7_9GAST|nr:hypothetical protein RRG08_066208 [Elysia crispata]
MVCLRYDKNPDKLVTFTAKNLLNNEHIVDSRSTVDGGATVQQPEDMQPSQYFSLFRTEEWWQYLVMETNRSNAGHGYSKKQCLLGLLEDLQAPLLVADWKTGQAPSHADTSEPRVQMCQHGMEPYRDVSINESKVKFKVWLGFFFCQYLPAKPIKWGIKIWALSESTTGYMSKVVKDLVAPYHHTGMPVYMDNFYTGVPLLREMAILVIGGCGTVCALTNFHDLQRTRTINQRSGQQQQQQWCKCRFCDTEHLLERRTCIPTYTQVYDLLDLSDSDVSDWIPESDEELDLDLQLQDEADPPENSQQSDVPGPSPNRGAANHDGGPKTPVPRFLPERSPGLNLPECQTRQDLQKACGTMIVNRKGFPISLKDVKQWASKAKRGDMRWERDEDLLYVQWNDNKPVTLLSTFHDANTTDVAERRRG